MSLSLMLTIAAGLFGAAIGSFLNVVILRYPNPPHGRSRCPHCHHQLSVLDLVPVLSWLMLGGRCRYCHATISNQYPLVEITTAVAAIILTRSVLLNHSLPLATFVQFIIVSLLIVLFLVDLRTMLLPDIFIAVLVGLVSLYDFISFYPIHLALAGGLLGAGSLLVLWFLTAGRGIGFGDVKIMLPLGLLFGPFYTIILLFTAFICGGLLGFLLLITKRATLKTAVPFGPFLAGTAILFILFPNIPELILHFLI